MDPGHMAWISVGSLIGTALFLRFWVWPPEKDDWLPPEYGLSRADRQVQVPRSLTPDRRPPDRPAAGGSPDLGLDLRTQVQQAKTEWTEHLARYHEMQSRTREIIRRLQADANRRSPS